MRGTPGWRAHVDDERGIIPAHAGNTSISSSSRSTARDHPRACGEHSMMYGVACALMGSSPRMRGTQIDELLAVFDMGIIPAHAGNTLRD